MSGRNDDPAARPIVLGYERPRPGPVGGSEQTNRGGWIFFRTACAATFVVFAGGAVVSACARGTEGRGLAAYICPFIGLSFGAAAVLALPGMLLLQVALTVRSAVAPSSLREAGPRSFIVAALAHVATVFTGWWGAFTVMDVRPFESWPSLLAFLAPIVIVPLTAPLWLLRPRDPWPATRHHGS